MRAWATIFPFGFAAGIFCATLIVHIWIDRTLSRVLDNDVPSTVDITILDDVIDI